MELVTILRELWRLRAIVAVIAALSILAGLAIAVRLPSLESRSYNVGVATARILVDTPRSQVVEVAPKGSDMLGVRANLIANLMTEGVVKAAIAERAGIAPARLNGVAESAAEPMPAAAPSPTQPYVLTTRVLATPDAVRLPIIEIETQAPDAAGAAGLAKAAASGLSDYLDTKAAAEKVDDAQRLRVSGLGSPLAQDILRGDRRLLAAFAAIFLFLAGCAAVVITCSLVRGWRLAGEWEELEREGDEPYEDDHLAHLDELFDEERFGPRPERTLRVTTPPDYESSAPEDHARRESA
jgi:hypothetical protein